MRIISSALASLLVVAVLAGCSTDKKPEKPAIEDIFDGKTLDGWSAPDMSFWRVEDGAITGQVTADHKPKENVFLVWQDDTVQDFELSFKFRMFGKAANSGMQFRSEVKERGLVHGYQADMSADGKWTGGVFDEYGPRGSLAAPGESVTWSSSGKKSTKALPEVPMPDTKKWTNYRIVAKGRHVTLLLNGFIVAELEDADPRRCVKGVLAVPIIPTEMKVQYKDLRLKRL